VESLPRTEAPPPTGDPEPPDDAALAGAPHLADPRALQILSTEHWSLLGARSLSYNEAFSRGQMFLTFLSASLVALGFVAGNAAAGQELPVVAAALLALDLFIGLATLGRLAAAGTEEFMALQGMARIRHAYLELMPGLEPYFSTSRNDDVMGVMAAYGATVRRPAAAQNVLHGFTTMPGMIGVINSAVAGALAASIVLAFGMDGRSALLVGILAGLVVLVVMIGYSQWYFLSTNRQLEVRFPSPDAPPAQPPGRRNT
jgi:hypothetical protein